MSHLPALMQLEDLSSDQLIEQIKTYAPRVVYDELFDGLIIAFANPTDVMIVHYLDDHTAVLYNEDKQIVGFQIEDFKRSFIRDTTKLNGT